MHLRELVIHDVGVYRGRQVVPLATSDGRPVVLVGGLNGCGKTTLLDSLQLALYGSRARTSSRGSRGYEDYLRSLINNKADASDGASLGLQFDVELEGATKRYALTRAWRTVGSKVRESLDVYVDGRRSRHLAEAWAEHIEELLPLDIAGLFFFDGEKIEALADPQRAGAVIRTAVHALLGIGTIDQLSADLIALQRRQSVPEDDAAAAARLKVAKDELVVAQRAIDSVAQRRGRLRVEAEQAARALDAADAAFRRDGGGLFEQRSALESARAQAQASKDAAAMELRRLADGSAPLALVGNLLLEIQEQAEVEERTHRDAQLVHLLLERDQWLVSSAPEELRQALEDLLERDRFERAQQRSTPVYLDLASAALARIREVPAAVRHDVAAVAGSLQQHAAAEDALIQADQRLAGVPEEDAIAGSLAQREERRLAKARLEGMLASADEEYDRESRRRDAAREAVAAAEGDLLRAALARSDVARVVNHSERVRSTLRLLKDRLVERHIGRIEVATLDAFTTLMRKQQLVTDLHINPSDFSITLERSDGSELDPTRLSAGERQLLAVALLWGLARVAGGRIPTVVDTPLGRLDSQHRERLIDHYFPVAGRQVLLLSTDEEIDAQLFKRLEPAVSHSYTLDHDEAAHTTTVTPGYWWEADSDVA